MRRLVLGLALVGCRIGFDARPVDAPGAGSDASSCSGCERTSDCEGVELACNDDSNDTQNKFSDVDTGPISSGSYDVFIDGFSTHSGTADVTITITP